MKTWHVSLRPVKLWEKRLTEFTKMVTAAGGVVHQTFHLNTLLLASVSVPDDLDMTQWKMVFSVDLPPRNHTATGEWQTVDTHAALAEMDALKASSVVPER